MKVAVISITRHGITTAGRVVAALPGTQLFAPEKFAAEAQAAAPGKTLTYSCKTGEQLGKLFSDHEAIVAVLSLGATVRMIAPSMVTNSRPST